MTENIGVPHFDRVADEAKRATQIELAAQTMLALVKPESTVPEVLRVPVSNWLRLTQLSARGIATPQQELNLRGLGEFFDEAYGPLKGFVLGLIQKEAENQRLNLEPNPIK